VVGTGLINLDEVRVLLDLVPYHRDQFGGTIGVGSIRGDVLGGIEVDCIFRSDVSDAGCRENAVDLPTRRTDEADGQNYTQTKPLQH
jgi:hypothetical protein